MLSQQLRDVLSTLGLSADGTRAEVSGSGQSLLFDDQFVTDWVAEWVYVCVRVCVCVCVCVMQMRIRLAEYVKRDVVSFDPPVHDKFLGRCIWWKPKHDSAWYKGTITSKDLGHSGEVLYHICYEDGDEADLETYELDDTDEYTFTSPYD